MTCTGVDDVSGTDTEAGTVAVTSSGTADVSGVDTEA